MTRWRPALVAGCLVTTMASCGLGPSGEIEDIDPLSLPARLLATSPPSPAPSADPTTSGVGTYFLQDATLRLAARTVTATSRITALQELLDNLAAGPDASDRRRGLSTALPPTTRLTVTRLDGGLATVDLTFGQVPPDQTTAIAQIVLTATSLPGVNRLLLTFDGKPLEAPLASGAQTDRPLTRSDYLPMLRGKSRAMGPVGAPSVTHTTGDPDGRG